MTYGWGPARLAPVSDLKTDSASLAEAKADLQQILLAIQVAADAVERAAFQTRSTASDPRVLTAIESFLSTASQSHRILVAGITALGTFAGVANETFDVQDEALSSAIADAVERG